MAGVVSEAGGTALNARPEVSRDRARSSVAARRMRSRSTSRSLGEKKEVARASPTRAADSALSKRRRQAVTVVLEPGTSWTENRSPRRCRARSSPRPEGEERPPLNKRSSQLSNTQAPTSVAWKSWKSEGKLGTASASSDSVHGPPAGSGVP
jgi:hypothetical protein